MALLQTAAASRTRSRRSSPNRSRTRSTSCCAASRPPHDATGGELLREPLADDPDEVYHALLDGDPPAAVRALRRGARHAPAPAALYARYYSLAGLYERLRVDAAAHPDTMEQRYGAWAQLLVVFRMINDGGDGRRRRACRRGAACLFDPDRYKFLEGRSGLGSRQTHERIEPPRVPDGTIHRALEKLLVLDGERISYRALDVEQIGSVYETMMGFRLESRDRPVGRDQGAEAATARRAPSTSTRCSRSNRPSGRSGSADRADRKLTPKVDRGRQGRGDARGPRSPASRPVIDTAATPDLVPPGRWSSSRATSAGGRGRTTRRATLTGPIVRTTLEPILERLRREAGGAPGPSRSST